MAEYWYGQPAPIVATRLNPTFDLGMSVDKGLDWVKGGIASGGFLYFYGCRDVFPAPTPPAAQNGCSIARTPLPANAGDMNFASTANYRYWNGTGFGTTSDLPSAQLITMGGTSPTPVDQLPGAGMSVEFIPSWGASGMFVTAYEPWPVVGDQKVVIRTATNLAGPWSDPVNGTALVSIDDCVSGTNGCYTMRVNPATTNATHLGLSYYQRSTNTLRNSTLSVTVT